MKAKRERRKSKCPARVIGPSDFKNARVLVVGDAMLDRYFVTIARAERVQLANQIIQHMTSQVIPLPLFYEANTVPTGNRLNGVIPGQVGWNSHEWYVQ